MSISLISASRMRDISTVWKPRRAFLVVAAMLTVLAGFATAVRADTGKPSLQLVMIETDGCRYCDLWHDEIGKTYAATSEGRRAPLVRLDIASTTAKRFHRVIYTPTFILIRTDGQEIGRITGYPGADHFWGQIRKFLSRAGDGNGSKPVPPKSPRERTTPSHAAPLPTKY